MSTGSTAGGLAGSVASKYREDFGIGDVGDDGEDEDKR